MIIVLYVDDLLITGSSKAEIASLKGAMNQAFSMTDLGLLSQFLGLENQGAPVQICLGLAEQIQNEGLKIKQNSFPFRSEVGRS